MFLISSSVGTLGPQLVVLFEKLAGPLESGASLKEVSHRAGRRVLGALQSILQSFLFFLLLNCGYNVTRRPPALASCLPHLLSCLSCHDGLYTPGTVRQISPLPLKLFSAGYFITVTEK